MAVLYVILIELESDPLRTGDKRLTISSWIQADVGRAPVIDLVVRWQ